MKLLGAFQLATQELTFSAWLLYPRAKSVLTSNAKCYAKLDGFTLGYSSCDQG